MNLEELSKTQGDEVAVHYVALSDVSQYFLEGNSKKHDIGQTIESIRRHGFQELPKFDAHVGIKAGNGRIEALCQMFEEGMNAPRGIKAKDKEWFVPVLFGVDSRSKQEAVAYSIDSNWSVLWGGEYTPLDASRMFDADALTAQLEELAVDSELPLSVDSSDLDLLLENMGKDEPLDLGEDGEIGDEEKEGGGKVCPHCGELL